MSQSKQKQSKPAPVPAPETKEHYIQVREKNGTEFLVMLDFSVTSPEDYYRGYVRAIRHLVPIAEEPQFIRLLYGDSNNVKESKVIETWRFRRFKG